MTTTYPSSIVNARLQVVESAIDGGGAGGTLSLYDALSNLLTSVTLAHPAGTVAGGTLSFNGLPLVDPLAAGTGLATSALMKDSNGNIVISGLTVGSTGVPGFDVVVSNGVGTTQITAGQPVTLTVATITGH